MIIQPPDQERLPPEPGPRFRARPALYVLIVLAVGLGVYLYKLRAEGIFSCQANGYAPGWYLAYCHNTGYGDYEHGAFWFGLEPPTERSVANADALFLGTSRIQIALSTEATTEWFASTGSTFFLTGFSYTENVAYVEPLLRRINPRARVYVINVDEFFSRAETIPARRVMHDPKAEEHYRTKQRWQVLHRPLCGAIPAICGNRWVIYRSRETGAYRESGVAMSESRAVSYDRAIQDAAVRLESGIAEAFLSGLPVSRNCILLTMVPTVRTKIGNAKAIASALGAELVVPELDGLRTFDGNHLDRASAERWSRAFLEAAAPRIRACLDGSPKNASAPRHDLPG